MISLVTMAAAKRRSPRYHWRYAYIWTGGVFQCHPILSDTSPTFPNISDKQDEHPSGEGVAQPNPLSSGWRVRRGIRRTSSIFAPHILAVGRASGHPRENGPRKASPRRCDETRADSVHRLHSDLVLARRPFCDPSLLVDCDV